MNKVSLATQEKINELVSFTFKQNSVADNIVYFLEFKNFETMADIIHHTYAHLFGGLADQITDFAKTQDIRVYRLGFEGDKEDFSNLIEAFIKLLGSFEDYQELVLETIEIAEDNGDVDVKTFFEDFSLDLGKYHRQLEIWLSKAKQYGENYGNFEANFEEFTHIPRVD